MNKDNIEKKYSVTVVKNSKDNSNICMFYENEFKQLIYVFANKKIQELFIKFLDNKMIKYDIVSTKKLNHTFNDIAIDSQYCKERLNVEIPIEIFLYFESELYGTKNSIKTEFVDFYLDDVEKSRLYNTMVFKQNFNINNFI